MSLFFNQHSHNGNNNCDGGGSCGKGPCPQHGGHGGDAAKTPSADYQRKKWEPMGIFMLKVDLMLCCKTCGYNTAHSTGHYTTYISNTKTFSVPKTHAQVMECDKFCGRHTPSALPVGPLSVTLCSVLTITGDSGLLSFNRSKFEQHINASECNSTNPNAVGSSIAFHKVLLK